MLFLGRDHQIFEDEFHLHSRHLFSQLAVIVHAFEGGEVRAARSSEVQRSKEETSWDTEMNRQGHKIIALFVASLLLVAMPRAPSSFLFLVVRPGAPSSDALFATF